MSDVIELSGTLNTNGAIEIINWNDVKDSLQKYVEQPISVKISKEYRHRSQRQNRYYWGVVVPVVQKGIKELEGILYSKEEIHIIISKIILGIEYKVVEYMGETIIHMNNKKTSDMNTQEFSQFVEDLQRHFSEKGIIIPDPNNQNYFNDFKF